jgi:cation diffusion facilitator CzcD-associated flavoprotein CzcO
VLAAEKDATLAVVDQQFRGVFARTAQRPADIAADLVYDTDRRLWRASVRQALRDMKATHRIKDLSTRPACREDFRCEMRRFLPESIARDTVEKDDYWSYLTGVVEDVGRKALAALPPAE